MLYLTKNINYHFYLPPVDMRKGCFKLCGIINNEMQYNVLHGDVFVFLAKHKRKIKLLQWDVDGFALYEKQLSKGSFELPIIAKAFEQNNTSVSAQQLHLILQGIVQSSISYKKRFALPTAK
jgi:transposase